MAEQSIAEWLQSEHEQVLVLSDRLRKCIAVVPRTGLGSWITDIRNHFEHFRAHLLRHIALEEDKGYLRIVLERRPTLAPRVQRLAHEHQELIQLVDNLNRSLIGLTDEDRLLAQDCCHRIGDLLNLVEHHESEENDLVGFVFTEDIGTSE